MKGVLANVTLALAALSACAAEPKVGCTIAFRGGYGPQQYQSNAHFKRRPVVEAMAKDGLDVCLYNGWGKADPVASLRQFNCIWLITEHEDECPYGAEEVGGALKAYVEAGGGLVVCHSAGRYPEAPVDAFWRKVFLPFGAEILHEEIADFSTRFRDPAVHQQEFFYAATKAVHPVTEGVPGLWLPMRGGFPSHCWSVPAVRYSPEWTPVLSTSRTGKSYRKNVRTNFVEWQDDNAGFYREGAPVAAVRTLGRGRIVFLAVHKDNCGWMYGIDRWPGVTEEGSMNGRDSKALRLVENALRWAAEPSLGDSSFTRGYRPVEPDEPPYRRIDAGPTPAETMRWPSPAPIVPKTPVQGVVGLHSTHSDGASSVAAYADEAKRLGLSFIVFTDDLADLSEERLLALRKDCATVSDASFYACPGVEFKDMTGLFWILYHDKVEFPKKDFLRDGRTYAVMKDGIVRQRNFYGHQNLYRGAILNTPRFAEAGMDSENLADFNGVVPKAYDVGRLVWNNETANKRIVANLHLVYPSSFTRVRRADDLAAAMRASVTCIDSVDGMREVTANKGANAWRAAVRHSMYVRCGGDVAIDACAFARVPGTDIHQVTLAARSSAGLGEVLLDDDGGTRVLARFDARGEKTFSRAFTLLLNRQMHPVLTVTDKAGNTAHHVPQALSYGHAGLNRCSDNANLLSQRPNIVFSPHWDDRMMPCWKFLMRPPTHWHFSEAFPWEGYGRNRSRLPVSRVDSQESRIRLRGVDYPSEAKGVMPSSQLRFRLIAPQSMAILEQIQGAKMMTPTRGPDRATYGFGPIQTQVGAGRYWVRRHRVYQLQDRGDSWWRAVWQRVVGAYRGGYAVCEGEIAFTEDVELAEPIELCRLETENAVGKIETFRTDGALTAGGYYATVADPAAWYAWFGLVGGDPLSVVERRTEGRVVSRLRVGTPRAYRQGERIRYRFACGSFVEPPREGEYLRWFAGMLDGSRFSHAVTRGRETGVSGLLDVAAEDGVAEVTLGPNRFIQDYPVRVSGLVDNGSAFAVGPGGRLFRPLGFEGDRAYVEVPLEERTSWRFMNLFLADEPALRFSYVPSMPGHERATVEIFNPTTRPCETRVRNLLTGESFAVKVPAGDVLCREL